MTVKLLSEHNLEFLSLKGGCRGSSESAHVKMPHCWKSHALAQIPSILFSGKRSIFGITQMLYRLKVNSHKTLSRYAAGYISESNKHKICSKVNIDKNITLF